jgi:predicted nucleic acid-binding protein
MSRILVDSNVLVYAADQNEPAKQTIAQDVLRQLRASGAGLLSAQVLGEFARVATARLRPPLLPHEAHALVIRYQQSWPVADLTVTAIIEALRAMHQHHMQFWDAVVWATARQQGVFVVLSEDLPPTATIEGVRFVDPFAAGFQLADWLA